MTDWAKDDLMDPPYAEEQTGVRRAGGSRLMRHAIALALVVFAIGCLAYAAWFGYKSWRTQGSEGLAPVIQADAGPTRVRPEQPGGIVIPHQERLVLHDLDGGGAGVSAESLLPPPEEPLPRPTPAVATTPAAPAAAPTPAYAAAEAPAAPVQTAAVATPAPAPAPAQTVEPVAVTPPVPQPAPAPAAPAADRNAEEKVPAIAAPAADQVAQSAEPAPELITRPAAEAAPAPEPEFVSVSSLLRSHRVQLAAVDSEESARRAWLRYQGLYQDLLGDLSLLVQQVEVNNRTFFRVQGGPLQADSAGRICQAIKSRGADCLVVRPSR